MNICCPCIKKKAKEDSKKSKNYSDSSSNTTTVKNSSQLNKHINNDQIQIAELLSDREIMFEDEEQSENRSKVQNKKNDFPVPFDQQFQK